MFRGPSRDDSMEAVGPFFSRLESFGAIAATGGAMGDVIRVGSYPIGVGSSVIVIMKTNFVVPSAATDVKWIDVALDYQWGTTFRMTTPEDLAFTQNMLTCPTDVVSSRDPRFPGTQILERRFQVHRFGVPNDPQNQHPFGDDPTFGERFPTIRDMAVGDNLQLFTRFVAVDRDATPVPTVGTWVQFAVLKGGHARSH